MNIAIILAGGEGRRMSAASLPKIPKQFLEFNNKSIIIYTIEHFEAHQDIDAIIVVCHKSWIRHMETLLETAGIKKVTAVIAGGLTAQNSVYNGLLETSKNYPEDSIVLIHDGVRPMIDAEVISRCIDTATQFGNAITTAHSIETIAMVKDNNSEVLNEVLDRNLCFIVRTPQAYKLCDVLSAYENAYGDNLDSFIDTSSLLQHYGHPLAFVVGPVLNIKITTPADYYTFCALKEAEKFGLED